MRLPSLRLPDALVVCALLLACASGCNDEHATAQPARTSAALVALPDCDGVDVLRTYEAKPSGLEGYYVVTDNGSRAICTTDFEGLQDLATRFDGASDSVHLDRVSSDPMPGRGTGLSTTADSDPMPGRGTNPASIEAERATQLR